MAGRARSGDWSPSTGLLFARAAAPPVSLRRRVEWLATLDQGSVDEVPPASAATGIATSSHTGWRPASATTTGAASRRERAEPQMGETGEPGTTDGVVQPSQLTRFRNGSLRIDREQALCTRRGGRGHVSACPAGPNDGSRADLVRRIAQPVVVPSGGCSSTWGRYSTSWMLPSKVRLSIISRATSG